ncbi:hypothetical protein B5M09_000761 [Aphanomyces astaci]|uniref:Uncharacterized protein n=1 Tax=Aphanomyces astaci TaxID=112090 RepID=A0A425D777_APHAT|nr:hypothetical protein B5M09_000761 [Aphanomyces astaci]
MIIVMRKKVDRTVGSGDGAMDVVRRLVVVGGPMMMSVAFDEFEVLTALLARISSSTSLNSVVTRADVKTKEHWTEVGALLVEEGAGDEMMLVINAVGGAVEENERVVLGVADGVSPLGLVVGTREVVVEVALVVGFDVTEADVVFGVAGSGGVVGTLVVCGADVVVVAAFSVAGKDTGPDVTS